MHRTIQNQPDMTFRLGVGGRWSAQDLERFLIDILGPTGWRVSLRESFSAESLPDSRHADSPETSRTGRLEIVPLGDGLGLSSACLDDEELAKVYPWEDWILAKSIYASLPDGMQETDLFFEVREHVSVNS